MANTATGRPAATLLEFHLPLSCRAHDASFVPYNASHSTSTIRLTRVRLLERNLSIIRVSFIIHSRFFSIYQQRRSKQSIHYFPYFHFRCCVNTFCSIRGEVDLGTGKVWI